MVRLHRARHAFAETDAPFSTHFDLENALVGGRIVHHAHVAVLEVPGFVRAKARVGHEEDVVVQLLRAPLIPVADGFCVLAGGSIELFVFGRAKPWPMNDLALRAIGRREIRQVRQPTMPDSCLQNLAQGHNLIMERAAGRRFARGGRRRPVHPIFLDLAGCDPREAQFSEEWTKMEAKADFVPLHPCRAAMTFRDNLVLFFKLVGSLIERLF
ncbi:hypothetical protein [Methyloceanibacter stevinii]|uniref:hypothetical protein n=1 Tax=Methyloceanibacter stevinii TaxID=1774970 RepID=UPI001FCDD941|nr:hypothetical protein [Methyloceanibacter stevinii]